MRKYTTLIALAGLLLAAGAADAGWNEGVAAFKAGNLDRAAREFRQIVEDSPGYDGGHFMLGQVLLKQRKNQEALTHLRKAYELKSDDVYYQMALSKAYLANDRFSDAATMLQRIKAGSLPRAQQEAYYQMLAVSLDRSGNEAAALDAYRQLTQQSPDDADAWFRYGTTAYNAGQTDTAVSALERAVRLAPDNADFQYSYGLALATAGQREKGVEHLQRAVSLDPDDEKKAESLAKLKGTELFLPLPEDHVEGSCLKEVFNRFCLGGRSESLPEPLRTYEEQDKTTYGYSHLDGVDLVVVRDGRIVMVRRSYSPASWIHWDDLVFKLDKVYEAGKDLSSFPDYANDRDSRATAIRLEEGRARRVWPAPGYNVELVWFGDDLYLNYRTPETQEVENPEGF